jgi:putative tryptophan/tyrosine transport system substrate-binding protein
MRRREFTAGLLLTATMHQAQAQQPVKPVIGYLSPGSPESDAFRVTAVRQGLSEAGYDQDRNLAIEYRWAQGHYDRLPALAADLVSRHVTVIVPIGPPATLAVKAATSTVPIVFNLGIDPIAAGLVASLSHPSGNATGVALLATDLTAKRLELVHELVPSATAIALLTNPANRLIEPDTREAREAARSLGLQVHILQAHTASEIETAFQTLVELRAGAVIVSYDTYFTNQRAQIVALAARHAVPGIYGWREYVVDGGLMSYGPSLTDSYRQAGVYVGRILKGERPADLPVQQVAKFELLINLKTAKALGISIPPSLLARVDEVIE